MQLKNNTKGSSLIEALIAVVIVIMIATGIMNMITMFGFSTKNRLAMECLINAVASQVERCRAMETPENQISCGGYTINIKVNGNCQPDNCDEVTITGRVQNVNISPFSLKTIVCNPNQQ
ncbi:MAG TPA: hypothetical protein ENO34_04300 [Sulfurihydrogenibium azorense]|uniref:Type II secretion system protein n=1 Tax=Sulfurihydrogenibium azorense TaxID=309806 RepID=A0A832DR01_9AQUI|nr:hypothetical protein [Sulfurihydrogenibium azorense]